MLVAAFILTLPIYIIRRSVKPIDILSIDQNQTDDEILY
jgi:hypothetical protein